MMLMLCTEHASSQFFACINLAAIHSPPPMPFMCLPAAAAADACNISSHTDQTFSFTHQTKNHCIISVCLCACTHAFDNSVSLHACSSPITLPFKTMCALQMLTPFHEAARHPCNGPRTITHAKHAPALQWPPMPHCACIISSHTAIGSAQSPNFFHTHDTQFCASSSLSLCENVCACMATRPPTRAHREMTGIISLC